MEKRYYDDVRERTQALIEKDQADNEAYNERIVSEAVQRCQTSFGDIQAEIEKAVAARKWKVPYVFTHGNFPCRSEQGLTFHRRIMKYLKELDFLNGFHITIMEIDAYCTGIFIEWE